MIPIVGWQKTSLIDYPQKISTILFTMGCNFRCPYCHNPQLVTGDASLEPIPAEFLFAHLTQRRKLLDGVVITGGEPTLHGKGLVELIRQIKELGYLVKLDTNGTNPALVRRLIDGRWVDYVAMDVKTSLSAYHRLTQYVGTSSNTSSDISDTGVTNIAPHSVDNSLTNSIRESVELLKSAAAEGLIEVEFRTTLHPALHTEPIFLEMMELLAGAPRYALQTFRSDHTLDPHYQSTQSFTEGQMQHFSALARQYVKECLLR